MVEPEQMHSVPGAVAHHWGLAVEAECDKSNIACDMLRDRLFSRRLPNFFGAKPVPTA